MKTTFTLLSPLIGLLLSATTVASRAQPGDAPPRPANHEEIRRLLQELPPEERRALIKELRDKRTVESKKPRMEPSRPTVNREEVSRELRALPPEARHDRIRELRGLPPDQRPEPEMRRPSGREVPRGERPPSGPLQAGQPGRFPPMFERVLTEEQRESFRDAMESHRAELRELEENLRVARRETFQASVAREFNEERVRQRAMAVARAEAELTVLRARALSRIKPSLSPEQIERLNNAPLLEGGMSRPEFRRDGPQPPRSDRGDRPGRSPRDENDLPPQPRPER